MDILEINNYLKQGKTVKEIRDILGYSEKSYQRKTKELGYKYKQKEKQYILENVEIMPVKASNTTCNTVSNTISNDTKVMTLDQEQSLNFISENIEDLKEMLMYYKRNKECSTSNRGIVINLIDDKEIDNGKPISVRVNKYIWKEWQEFTKDISYSSKELISMALSEYMEKYK